ncbi:MAG: radical SAM protein [Anaerolineales bacterium]|nr:radical SAM protein [Anaerolineales bacterium]
MPNLMLTNRCNIKCDFCFAVDMLPETPSASSNASFGVFQAYIDLLDRAGLDQARLLGGEPTLHPEFSKFLEYARARGKKILVFTNGLIPKPAMLALMKIPPVECTALINLASGDASPAVRRRQEFALAKLGQRACPGYTISRMDHPDLTQLLDLIDRTGCQRCLRIAMAQPSGGGNKFIHPKQYRRVAQRVLTLASEAGRRGIRVEFDCGFVRCMFTNDEIETLRESGASVAWHCSPVWDITPEAVAFPCFALTERLRIPQGLDRSLEELQIEFDSALSILRVAGVYPECSSCEVRAVGGCSGGCLAVALRRMRSTPITHTLSAAEAAAFLNL